MKFCDPSFFSISKDRLFCSSFQQLPLFMATEDENSIQERYGEYRNSKTVLVLGVRMPPFYVKGFKDFIENFQTRHDDVFIVGFPRSGELIILSKSETKTKNFQKYFVMKTRPTSTLLFLVKWSRVSWHSFYQMTSNFQLVDKALNSFKEKHDTRKWVVSLTSMLLFVHL